MSAAGPSAGVAAAPVISLPKAALDPVHWEVTHAGGSQPVQDLLDRYGGDRSDTLAFLSGQGRFDYQPIGAPIMSPGLYHSTIVALLGSARLRKRLAAIARRKAALLEPRTTDDPEAIQRRIEKGLEGVARRMAEEMAARIESPRLIRTYGLALQTFFARLYNLGIHCSVEEIANLRKVAVAAAAKKQSLIFLPCHKSHVDYLLLSWLCWRVGLALPHIIAGENLNLPIVGGLLRRGGAVYIRRKWDDGDDPLYPTVANEYLSLLIEQGHSIEVFIEGTRSRSGKVLPPKLGILKVILDAVLEGRTTDVVIVPISIQYERVLEGRTYVQEMLGTPKEAESLSGVLSSSSVLGLKLGRIDVRFAEPYSLQGLIDEETSRRSVLSAGPTFDIKAREADKQTFLRQLGYRVLSDINTASVAMPSALVATAILTLRTDRGVSKKELVRRVDWLTDAIRRRAGRVADFGGLATEAVVDRTIASLSDLIGRRKAGEVIDETIYAKKPIELSLYRNQISHMFLSESILCASLYLKIKTGRLEEFMSVEDLTTEARWLSDLLKMEFVFPLAGIGANVRSTLDTLVRERVLLVENDAWPARVRLSERERSTGREQFDFFCFSIWPLIESYWLASVAMYALLPAKTPRRRAAGSTDEATWSSEGAWLQTAQRLGKTLFWQGDLSNLEAISTFALQNALGRAAELGIVLRRRRRQQATDPAATGSSGRQHGGGGGGPPLIALDPTWAHEEALASWVERVGTFRREGKSRRTNELAARRVYELASSLKLPTVETTLWPLAAAPSAAAAAATTADFQAAPPLPARL